MHAIKKKTCNNFLNFLKKSLYRLFLDKCYTISTNAGARATDYLEHFMFFSTVFCRFFKVALNFVENNAMKKKIYML